MQPNRLVLMCTMLVPAFSVQAQTPPAAPWTTTGNATFVSDYVFRGVSQSQAKPTGQFTIDFTHSSGAYAGLFGSGVSHAAYNNGAGSEVDIYGGYRAQLGGEGNFIDAGLVTYWFPGAHYVADGHDIKYHTQEMKLGINLGAFNAYAWVTPTRTWFGFAIDPATGKYNDTRGTSYAEVNWNPELQPGTVLNLHAGHQVLRHLGEFNYTDFKIGITQTWGSWVVTVNATHNSGKAERNGLPYWRFFNADGTWKNVTGSRFFVTAGKTF